MSRHEFFIPDCPECGAEMVKRGTVLYERWVQWWRCPKCGAESEHVMREDFDALTEHLTEHMRGK